MVRLVTFASKRFYKAMDLIVAEAEDSGFFNSIKTYTDVGLPTPLRDYGNANPRGYGYWRWKPLICLAAMSGMKDGDVLVYADAGCAINPNGDMKRWIEMAGESILSFHLTDYFTERRYTKSYTLDLFNARELVDTPQVISGCFIVRVNDDNRNILKEWNSAASSNPKLFNDDLSVEDIDFIDHRHDQSVLSLIFKKNGCVIIPDETYHDGHGNYNPIAPIWATRRR